MSVVARVILALTLPAVLACAAFGPRPPTARSVQPESAAVAPISPLDPATPTTEPTAADDDTGAVDLYGNAVTDAVARYKLDATGTLYEAHSPQTELPRLQSPKG